MYTVSIMRLWFYMNADTHPVEERCQTVCGDIWYGGSLGHDQPSRRHGDTDTTGA